MVARRVVPLPLGRRRGTAPTHLVALADSAGRSPNVPLIWPPNDPEIYAAERPAAGPRGSLLVYRTDVFHRAVEMTAPGRGPLPAEHQLQARGSGLDRLPHDAVARVVAALDRVRRRVDAARARPVRLPAAGSSDLGRGAARRDGRALSEPRSHAVARRARSGALVGQISDAAMRADARRVAEHVGAVDELIDRTDPTQLAQRCRRQARAGETVRVEHAETGARRTAAPWCRADRRVPSR